MKQAIGTLNNYMADSFSNSKESIRNLPITNEKEKNYYTVKLQATRRKTTAI